MSSMNSTCIYLKTKYYFEFLYDKIQVKETNISLIVSIKTKITRAIFDLIR